MVEAERFTITRLVSKNGTGGIYEALDTKHDQRVLLHRLYAENGDTSTRGWDFLFKDIARQWQIIDHSGFMKMHSADIDEDGAYMSLRYFEYSLLLAVYPNGMPVEEFYNFATQACSVIDAIHDMGVVHGALVPNSFLISLETVNQNKYILSDLGLTGLVPKINKQYAKNFLPSDPALLAPELFEKIAPVFITDIYMLGHIFYYILAGVHPLANLPLREAERRHFQHDFSRVDEIRPHIPENIATWIQSMMLPHPEDRLQDMRDVIANMPPREDFVSIMYETA